MRVRWMAVVVASSIALAALTAAAEDSSGVGTPAFPPVEASWLETLNVYRAQSGLPPVVDEPTWVAIDPGRRTLFDVDEPDDLAE